MPESRIDAVFAHDHPDDPMIVEFTLTGAPMMILMGGEMIEHSPAASNNHPAAGADPKRK
jgi:hypothetical protein